MGQNLYFCLQRIFHYLKRLIAYKTYYYNIFESYSSSLMPGEYRLFWDKVRFSWIKATQSQWRSALASYSLRTKIKILFFKNYAVVSSADGISLGTELIISRRQTAVKIINRDQNQVITYYLNRNDFDITSNFWKEFVPFFGTTTILSLDYEHLKVTETLICEKDDWKSDDDIKNNCICWFMESLLRYCRRTTPVCFETVENIVHKIDSYSVSSSIEKKALMEVLELLVNGIKGTEKEELPCINSHCDLSFFNILYDGKQFFLIDWEYYHTNLFCFDCLYWISYEAMVNQDYSFLDLYFAGRYDDWLEQIFNASGFPYYREKRRLYIYFLLLAELEMHLSYSEMGLVRSYGDFVRVLHYLDSQKE